MATWLVVALSFVILINSAVCQNPIVCTNNGCIQGTTIPATNVDNSFEAFYAIPYAEPPVGDLRFAVSDKIKKSEFLVSHQVK